MKRKPERKSPVTPAGPRRGKAADARDLREASAAFVFAGPIHAAAGRLLGVETPPNDADDLPVFLITDNRLLRDGVTAMLAKHGIRVIDTAHTAKDALLQVPLLKRHLVLLDTAIKDMDSLLLVEAVRAASKDLSMVVMALLPTEEEVGAFVKAGVAGFIFKNSAEDVFIGTIRAVAGGAYVLPRPRNGPMLQQVAARIQARGPRVVKAAVRMTKRERDVVALIAKGATNEEIGRRLRVATHTVKSHVQSIMEKLTLHTRLQVAAFGKAAPLADPA